jgi:hypothetical protein
MAGPTDNFTASLYLWGSEGENYNHSAWRQAKDIGYGGQGVSAGINEYAANSAGLLVLSTIPPMEEKPERFARLVRSTGSAPSTGFGSGKEPLLIPARTKASILLDHGHLTMGYPQLQFSGVKESKITTTYAEALLDDKGKKATATRQMGKAY